MKNKEIAPNVLYKYSAFSDDAISSLINKTVWFADPRSFNDPFDCRFDILESSPKSFKMPAKIGVEIMAEKFNACKKDEEYDSPKEYRNKLEKALTEIGVLCLSSSNDNMLMWSHYADKHKGFCLSFRMIGNDIFKVRRVDYEGKYTEIRIEDFADKPDRYIKDVIFNKASDWEYEGEYRIVIDIPDGDDSKRNIKWEYFMVLDSIYIGYEMPEHHRDAIKKLFKSDSSIKIIKMEQVPDQLQVKPKDW
ncbi:MAG: DUF2971 domain-containing protein [Candidatus Scalindua rubra]|uniref:DUF2971 domain-containing protein n=1 Tax=Candidatus Scalindua brodae TaxID=237368 RepID=A0A0B0EN74_9BACT|nr:MAG: hypothetical protein SCABRO_00867 [Candidatus Scalindua brodae]MBZ0108152.1 DUF2971 domain-containing protein [Candidatus Scalindua rubra]TWU31230.1 hypothetical protein S225a_21760 [Candidatus Brocadiaceae bacterium S225]